MNGKISKIREFLLSRRMFAELRGFNAGVRMFAENEGKKKSFWQRHKGKILAGMALAGVGGLAYANRDNIQRLAGKPYTFADIKAITDKYKAELQRNMSPYEQMDICRKASSELVSLLDYGYLSNPEDYSKVTQLKGAMEAMCSKMEQNRDNILKQYADDPVLLKKATEGMDELRRLYTQLANSKVRTSWIDNTPVESVLNATVGRPANNAQPTMTSAAPVQGNTGYAPYWYKDYRR